MPSSKRPRLAPTDDWAQLQFRFAWAEQASYELVRPVVLFGLTPAERARQTGVSASTIARKADRFDAYGIASFLTTEELPPQLPPELRQCIVEIKAEYAALRPYEIAAICYVRFGRRPSPHTVARIVAEDPLPLPLTRRFPPCHEIGDPVQRRLAIIRLHAEGWRISRIAGYLQTSRPTVYATLRRWIDEQFRGLADQSRAPKHPRRKIDLRTLTTVRHLQQNPELGEFRVHAALKQVGIELSPRTCGRILALNRQLYDLAGPSPAPPPPHEPQPMPFAAVRRHQYWTVDVRYIDHQLDDDNVEVLGWVKGATHAPEQLEQAFTRRFHRWLDQVGYVRFRHWRLYGERSLAKQPALVWLYGETLTVAFREQPLAQYEVRYSSDERHLRAVTAPVLFETPYRSLQPPLWEPGPDDWLLVVRMPAVPRRARRRLTGIQAQLPPAVLAAGAP